MAVIKSQKEVFICDFIGHKWVASATHCTVDHPANNIHVYAGYPTSRFLNYEQNIIARAKYEHPDYDPNYNDLVVIELKHKFKPSKFIRPVALPLSSRDTAGVGTPCEIAGFGETQSEKADSMDRTLQEGTVSKRFDCLFAYGSHIGSSHICANNPHATTGVCRGDSGGPLVATTAGESTFSGELRAGRVRQPADARSVDADFLLRGLDQNDDDGVRLSRAAPQHLHEVFTSRRQVQSGGNSQLGRV